MAKLFVIAGHGAGDCGAVGNGYQEAERVRALAQRIKDFGGANVVLGDFNRNYYKDNGISSLTISKEYKIIELHMDSGAATARGGHVIINGNFKADQYDTALADLMKTILPGRSSVIVGRTDLANVKRAANKGYNYRLLECGFISNAEDVKIFNSKMDDIAKGILNCFGIGSGSAVPPAQGNPTPTTPPAQKKEKLTVDGRWGVNTTKVTQRYLKTIVDGVVSRQPASNRKYLKNAFTDSWQFTNNYKGGSAMIKALQRLIGTTADGYFGKNSVIALQNFLIRNGYSVGKYGADGVMGYDTVCAWQRYLNAH